jgi:HSP20 family protein
MSLNRWDPFGAEEAFDRLLPGLLGQWPTFTVQGNAAKLEWRPRADISESEQEFLIRAELPAVKKEDVKVTFDSGILTIEGERKQEKDDKSAKQHRIERLYGSFVRSFSLPDNIDANAIRCASQDGVLTVHVPKVKADKAKAKQIKVE